MIKKHAFLERDDINFDNLPRVFFVKDNSYFLFDGNWGRLDQFLNQINKIMNPLIELKDEQSIE